MLTRLIAVAVKIVNYDKGAQGTFFMGKILPVIIYDFF